MRRAALLFAGALWAAPTARAAPWFWLSPTPGGSPLAAAAAPAAGVASFVGAGGTILATRDGGKTFSSQSAPSSVDLHGVFFLPDGLTGWAVGAGGTILGTANGGTLWTAQPSPTTRGLYAVAFTDSQHGFAAGDRGALLQTANGGATWTLRDGQLLAINGLAFPDPLHGFAAGWGGNVLVTTDGGDSWTEVFTGTTEDLLAVAFSDANHGWAVGAGGTIVATSDGGHSWQLQGAGLVAQDLVAVAAASAAVAYAIGADGAFYFTADGANWQTGLWPSPDTLTALALAPDGTLWAAAASGHVYVAPPAAPGAQNFGDENRGLGLADTVLSLAFADASHGVLAAGSGLWRTANGGATLTQGQIAAPTTVGRPAPAWRAVAMPTPAVAFAVGTGGGVVTSHDGGATWTWLSDAPSFTEADLYTVCFLDPLHGWIGGAGGLVLSTNDGGQSWLQGSVAGAVNVRALYFTDAAHGYAVGDYGSLATTQDGQSWIAAALQPVGNTLYAVGGVPPGPLWAAGSGGYMVESPDQGASWYPVAGPTSADLRAVRFLDPLDGYLAASKPGLVLVTHDGGQTWTVQFAGVPGLRALAFADALHGFAGGAAGTLLGTVTGGEPACQSVADCAGLADGGGGYACTGGACTACNQDTSCGATCAACGGALPFCRGDFCGQCRTTADCTNGGTCISGGCVVNVPFPDDAGRPAVDGGRPAGGRDGGNQVVTILPDGGISINPAAACGCKAGNGNPWAAFLPLLVVLALARQRRRLRVP